MKATLFALSAFAALAVAADSECSADYIVEACLSSQVPLFEGCAQTDYECRCDGITNIITCFNNCPNDKRRGDWEGQKQIFCGYASQFPSSTTKAAAATATNSQAKTTAAKDEATNTANGGATSTATGTAAAATNTDNGAADLVFNAGSMLAGVAAVVAAVL